MMEALTQSYTNRVLVKHNHNNKVQLRKNTSHLSFLLEDFLFHLISYEVNVFIFNSGMSFENVLQDLNVDSSLDVFSVRRPNNSFVDRRIPESTRLHSGD